MSSRAPYFVNHDRRTRFPWSLYHGELSRFLADGLRDVCMRSRVSERQARVLVVGCGLEPFVDGVHDAEYFGVDLDPASIATCADRHPEMKDRLGVCPDPRSLPSSPPFDEPFDAIVGKEVIEHVLEPERWAAMLAERLAPGGELLLTTPNYGSLSTLALLERTVLEMVARRDGYSRRDIHPSRFDRRRLASLALPGVDLVEVRATRTRWALFGRWRRRPLVTSRA